MLLRYILTGILMGLIARAFWRVIDGFVQGITGRSEAGVQRGMQMVRDPVCGTFVLPDRAVTLAEGSRQLFFCSTSCRDKYRARTA